EPRDRAERLVRKVRSLAYGGAVQVAQDLVVTSDDMTGQHKVNKSTPDDTRSSRIESAQRSALTQRFREFPRGRHPLLIPRSQVRSLPVMGFKMSVHAAARWYSWMSPPGRSRRSIFPVFCCWAAVAGSGGCSASPRCGRSRL